MFGGLGVAVAVDPDHDEDRAAQRRHGLQVAIQPGQLRSRVGLSLAGTGLRCLNDGQRRKRLPLGRPASGLVDDDVSGSPEQQCPRLSEHRTAMSGKNPGVAFLNYVRGFGNLMARGSSDRSRSGAPLQEYHSLMQVIKGTVVGGKVVLDGASFPEGAEVAVFLVQREATVRLPLHLQKELEDALDEADREDGISAEELFAELRKYG